MKSISKIKTENVLTIDIETVRDYEDLNEAPIEVQSAWENKNKKEGVVPEFDLLSKLYKQKAPLYPEFSKICSISVGYLSGGTKLKVKTYFGKNEVTILENFTKDLAMFCSFNPNYVLCGHVTKFFDYPFICKRLIINGMDIPGILDESDAKPWEMKNIDTNDLWKSFGTGYGATLETLCMVLRIPISKADLVGDEVGTAYFNDEDLRVAEYCSRDVVSSFNVLRKLKKESTFTFDEVEYIFQEEEAGKVKINVLDHILASGELSDKSIEALVKSTIENDLDRESTVQLVKTALSGKEGLKKVDKETLEPLKKALGLLIDFSLLGSDIIHKKNIDLKLADELVTKFLGSSESERKEVLELSTKFLEEYEKKEQPTAVKSMTYLGEMLISQKYLDIRCVVKKGSLLKTQANELIKQNKTESLEKRKEIIKLTKEFLVERGEYEKETPIQSFIYLEEKLLKN